MKTILSLSRLALLALALGTAGFTTTFAQTTAPGAAPTGPGGWGGQGGFRGHGGFGGHFRHHFGGGILTPAERTELKTARKTVIANNPGFKQQFQALRSQGRSPATKAQWQALRQQFRAAELAIDPNLATIFAKLEAAHKGGFGGKGGRGGFGGGRHHGGGQGGGYSPTTTPPAA